MVENYAQGNTTIWDSETNAVMNALAGFGIITGCSISKGTGDWDIDVTSGTVLITGTGEVSVSSGTVTLTDPTNDADLDAGESRIDLITADTGGSLAGVEGTAATNPDSPDIPTDEVILGFVVIAESDNTLADSTINDIPALLGDDSTRYDVDGSQELAFAEITTGTYTGDGSTSQSITGIGFQPVFVYIVPRETSDGTNVPPIFTTDQIVDDNANGGAIQLGQSAHQFVINRIISLDSDGFTVDDAGADEHPNKNTQVYNYMVIG